MWHHGGIGSLPGPGQPLFPISSGPPPATQPDAIGANGAVTSGSLFPIANHPPAGQPRPEAAASSSSGPSAGPSLFPIGQHADASAGLAARPAVAFHSGVPRRSSRSV